MLGSLAKLWVLFIKEIKIIVSIYYRRRGGESGGWREVACWRKVTRGSRGWWGVGV